jgi:hypothetical protein
MPYRELMESKEVDGSMDDNDINCSLCGGRLSGMKPSACNGSGGPVGDKERCFRLFVPWPGITSCCCSTGSYRSWPRTYASTPRVQPSKKEDDEVATLPGPWSKRMLSNMEELLLLGGWWVPSCWETWSRRSRLSASLLNRGCGGMWGVWEDSGTCCCTGGSEGRVVVVAVVVFWLWLRWFRSSVEREGRTVELVLGDWGNGPAALWSIFQWSGRVVIRGRGGLPVSLHRKYCYDVASIGEGASSTTQNRRHRRGGALAQSWINVEENFWSILSNKIDTSQCRRHCSLQRTKEQTPISTTTARTPDNCTTKATESISTAPDRRRIQHARDVK